MWILADKGFKTPDEGRKLEVFWETQIEHSTVLLFSPEPTATVLHRANK
jgi:hypothetical protein